MALLKKKFLASIAITVIVAAISAGLILWNPLEVIHLKLSNFLYTRNSPSNQITIIAIDDKSINPATGLGSFKNWPRTYYAQLIEKLMQYNPAVIGFDIDFSKYSKGISDLRLSQIISAQERGEKIDYYYLLKDFTLLGKHPDDAAFGAQLLKSPGVLGYDIEFLKDITGFSYRNISMPVFADIKSGFLHNLPDKDGINRRTFFWLAKKDFSEPIQSFALAVARKVNQRLPDYSDLLNKPALIDFSAKPYSYKTISFLDALIGKISEGDIKGKIILVGATAKILQDIWPTPVSQKYMPGVEFHANIIQQLLENRFLRDQTKIKQVLAVCALSFAAVFAMNFAPIALSPIFLILLFVLYSFSAKFFFDRGIVLNLIYPYFAFLFAFFGSLMFKYATELREKLATKKAFSHYVNKEVVSEILKHPEMLKLGGEKREISVLFTDIVSFTSLAEKMKPEDLVALLNEYLTAMTEVVFDHKGTLDKYEGDAIMAFFGAPLPNADHAQSTLQCAFAMRSAITKLHEKWHMESKPLLDFCAGISTGSAIIGNIGSETRFDYTAIGDIVNLGARLESLNRLYGTKILTDESTMQAAESNMIFRKLDRVRVKGKAIPTTIYELVSADKMLKQDHLQFLRDFGDGVKLYESRNFEDAKKYFEAALKAKPSDGPSQIYKNRCDFFIKTPPPENWDFVVELEQK